MMVSCPKCGFTQPSDRYCASCGVDMVAYKPAAKSLTQKLVSSWVLQVIVLGVVIFAGYSWLKERNTIEDRVADIEDAPNVRVIEEMERPVRDPAPTLATTSAQSTASSGAADTSVSSHVSTSQAPTASRSGSGQGSNDEGTSADAATQPGARGLLRSAENALGENAATNRSDSTQVQRLRVVFAETQRQMAADLVASARNLASYGMQGGVVTDLANRLRAEAGSLRALESPSEHPVRLNQPIVVFKGARDEATGQNVGISMQIVPVAHDENGLTMQVEVLRALREPSSAQIAEQNFQETFVAPKGGGAFMIIPLPRRALTEDEARLYSGAQVLRVLGSRAYQANSSDLVIFIEAR
ncbi:MAG: zinc ribbon domain-containing protein [Bdellovibrionaceae bacterium]|nr:zinc ribbon domain-containing protein [Pseudobdellovibrionaceae bacterium]